MTADETALVREHRRVIRSLARRFASSTHLDADDLEQEATIHFLAAVRTHDPTLRPLWSYAYGVMVRGLLKLVRTTRSQRHGRGHRPHSLDKEDTNGKTLHERIGVAPSQESTLAEADEARALREAIRRLPPLQAWALEGMLDGRSLRELARDRGVTHQAVSLQTTAGIERLRTTLGRAA